MPLRIELQPLGDRSESGEWRSRALLFNEGYEAVTVSRNAFVGPNLKTARDAEVRPDSVEATFGGPEDLLTLQPFTFFGRERTFNLAGGADITLSAYYRETGTDTEVSATISVALP